MLTSMKRWVKRSRGAYLKLGRLFALYRNALIRLSRLRGYDDNMVVFSAFDYRSYNDNPRYISEALHLMRPQTDIVWLFKDGEGARARFDIPEYVRIYNSIERRGVCAMARARVVVDNFNKRFYLAFPGKGQEYIQTWHGDRAFKKVGYDNVGIAYTGNYKRMLEEHATLGIVGSRYGEMQFRSAFHYKGALMREGYPRNDLLVRCDPKEREDIRQRLGIGADTLLLLYAPTYRDEDSYRNRAQSVRIDLTAALNLLEETSGRAWKCLIRAHYLASGFQRDAGDPRMIDASAYPEMGELLLAADALITDYSSCAGDFALCRRPIWLYQDDYEDYCANNRALYFDMSASPYMVAHNMAELEALIRATSEQSARKNCDDILEFYGECESGRAAEQIARYIVDKLKEHTRR